jgi:hypothetical protein
MPDEMRGRVVRIWTLIFGGMIPLGSLQAGLMAAAANVSKAPLNCAEMIHTESCSTN